MKIDKYSLEKISLNILLLVPRIFLSCVIVVMLPLFGFLAMVDREHFSDYVENAINSVWN